MVALNCCTSGFRVTFGASVKRPSDFVLAPWYQLESFARKSGPKIKQESNGWQLSKT